MSKHETEQAFIEKTITPQKTLKSQILRFGVVGVIGFIINAGMVELFAPNIGLILAQVFAFPAAVTATWWLNQRYTFGKSRYAWHHELLRYIAANALGWVANNGIYFFMILKFSLIQNHPSLAVAAGSLAGMIFNFSFSKWIVFK